MARQEGNSLQQTTPRILLWDVETSLIVATTFSLKTDYLPYSGIIEDWHIICAAWKWLGEETTATVKITKYGKDKEVCKKLRDVLASADIIVHHNGDKFDVKKLNARLIYHGLEPLPKLLTVDTLKQARKIAQFTSNRLDYLGHYLLGEGKLDHEQGLWMKVRNNDKEALRYMEAYNVGDVVLLEKIYLKLRPYMTNHPHVGMLSDGVKKDCPKCGSLNTKKDNVRTSASGVKMQQYKCKDCGGYHTTTLKEAK